MDRKSLRKRWARCAAACLFALLFGSVPARAAGEGIDVILLLDASSMAELGGAAEGEPWLACPCLNPEHFYLRPAAVNDAALRAGVTFPAAETLADGQTAGADEVAVYDETAGGWVALSTAREYRFSHSFLSEQEAHGWQPWCYHFMRDAEGVPVRIKEGEACGCFGRLEAGKALARALAATVLAENAGNRVAFAAFGEAGSSRWSCPLTGALPDVLACIDASPVQRGGDHAAGLARALRLLNRRPLSERLGRRAVVVVISGGETFPAGNSARALRLAEALKADVGAETPAVFGVPLLPEERRGCGAEVIAIGLWDGGSAFLDAFASNAEARFSFGQNETAVAAASAVIKRIVQAETLVVFSQVPFR